MKQGYDVVVAGAGNAAFCAALAALPTGDRELTNLFSEQSYPVGIVVNAEGRRFVDEGVDFRNYTYAKHGAEILRQPDAVAYQLFDSKTEPLLWQDEYSAPGVSRSEANALRRLAAKMGVAPDALEGTVAEFNGAVCLGDFDPTIKDGKRTEGIEPPTVSSRCTSGEKGEIDVSECPVYLLTGEYDHACSAGETEETARAIRGVCRWCARTRLGATSS
jgi:hypothetical protein